MGTEIILPANICRSGKIIVSLSLSAHLVRRRIIILMFPVASLAVSLSASSPRACHVFATTFCISFDRSRQRDQSPAGPGPAPCPFFRASNLILEVQPGRSPAESQLVNFREFDWPAKFSSTGSTVVVLLLYYCSCIMRQILLRWEKLHWLTDWLTSVRKHKQKIFSEKDF